MHIGIDFDNTIVNYDDVFYKYDTAEKLITPGIKANKYHIGNTIRKLPDGNQKWTLLQGKVYGEYILEAKPMHGVKRFLQECLKRAIPVSVVSHKTQYPALGPRVDLREASIAWLRSQGLFSEYGLAPERIYFADSIDEKISIITSVGFNLFIDDLDIILAHKNFPLNIRKIYLSKHKAINSKDIVQLKSWHSIRKYVFHKP